MNTLVKIAKYALRAAQHALHVILVMNVRMGDGEKHVKMFAIECAQINVIRKQAIALAMQTTVRLVTVLTEICAPCAKSIFMLTRDMFVKNVLNHAKKTLFALAKMVPVWMVAMRGIRVDYVMLSALMIV